MFLTAFSSMSVFADIYQWEWVDPSDQSLGKKQSTTLCPDGSGVDAAPNAYLNSKNLTQAYLHGVDLTAASFSKTTLFINADLSQATLINAGAAANFTGASLHKADLSNATCWNLDVDQYGSPSILYYATFTDADLSQANFTNTYIGGSTLTNANFTDAIINGANFSGATSRGFTSAQLYSTASYKAFDLSGVIFSHTDLTGWSFANQNLTNAQFYSSTLTNANISDAIIKGASFQETLITSAQLCSTASYKTKDLTGVKLQNNDLSGINFAEQNLTDADLSNAVLTGADLHQANLTNANLIYANFSGANLHQANLTGANFDTADLSGADLHQTNLTGISFVETKFINANFSKSDLTKAGFMNAKFSGANFTDAIITGASFLSSPIAPEQLYSTANYKNKNLSGVNFPLMNLTGFNLSNQNLTNVSFFQTTLTNVDFTDAIVNNVDFFYTKITSSQLYSTASYKSKDLSGISFEDNDLSGWIFAGQNLIHASFSNVTNADFSGADLRGVPSSSTLSNAIQTNMIKPDGSINGLNLSGGKMLIVRNYHCYPSSSELPIAINILKAMNIGTDGTLQFRLDEENWDSKISFAPGISVALGGQLELLFADGVDVAGQVGRTFSIFDWTGVTPTGSFNVDSPYSWNLNSLYETGTITLQAVPEPASVVLLVSGMLFLGIGRFYKYRQN
jgi:uncharacterized protein YjbI with pentapeptide repeats